MPAPLATFPPSSEPWDSSERPSTSSERSTCSMSSSGTSSSVGTGHLSLIPSVGTTDKFTQKRPKPQSLKDFDARSTGNKSLAKLGQAATMALEEGRGLGMDGGCWCLAAWNQADVMYIADSDILILITRILHPLIRRFNGALLNSRPILAVYALPLWPAFISILAIGYISYKQSTFALDHKLNLAWSQYFTPT